MMLSLQKVHHLQETLKSISGHIGRRVWHTGSSNDSEIEVFNQAKDRLIQRSCKLAICQPQ